MIALLLLLLPAFAQEAPEGDSRDEDIFGPSTQPTQELKSDQDIALRLMQQDNRLTIGGLGYLRANAYIADGDEAGAVKLDSPSFLDLYADARPTDRLRLYARGRLSHDLSVQQGDTGDFGEELQATRVALDQLWLNLDIGRTVFVTAGKQRIKWGAGRLWNPTDFLAPSTFDALTVFDQRMGVGLVKAHIPFERSGTNLYLIADLQGASQLDEVGGAARVEQIVGPGEVALSAALGVDEPLQLGAQLSFPLWLFDLKGEVAVLNGVESPGWEGGFDLLTGSIPTEVDRSDDWIVQASAGFELGIRYNDEDSVFWGAEGLYNQLGVDDPDLYPWLLLNGQFTPFYLGRVYAASYLYLPGPGRADDHSFTLTGISNLSDQTLIGRLDWSVRVLTELTVNSYAQVHGGPEGGEFAFALQVPPIPDVLDEGLQLSRPLVDLGLGAQLRF